MTYNTLTEAVTLVLNYSQLGIILWETELSQIQHTAYFCNQLHLLVIVHVMCISVNC